MRVLSLFDGISCGQVALERAGIPVEVYYASEIDKYAIQITQKNYPNTIQLGDVNNINFNEFKGKVDLIIGGSPCQDLSIAGKRARLQGERSGLFYKFVEAIEVIRPKYFLFENVASMRQEEKDLISSYLKVEPILINSSLVSAQDRKRLYWTNIPNVTQPEDKQIYLEDVVEPDALIDRDKSHAILASIGRTTHREYFKKNQGQLVYIAIMLSNIYGGFKEKKPRVKVDKSFCIRTAREGGHLPSLIIEGKAKNISLENFKECIECNIEKLLPKYSEEILHHKKLYTILIWINLIIIKKIYMFAIKMNTLAYINSLIKLQGNLLNVELSNLKMVNIIPISATQRYKAIGNGWTVDVIAHIFSFLEEQCG